jgi:hypothetical protein
MKVKFSAVAFGFSHLRELLWFFADNKLFVVDFFYFWEKLALHDLRWL